MSTIAIIAALDRELAPLVRDWQAGSFSHNGRNFRAYQKGDVVAMAGGIGPATAARAARAVADHYKPQLLISAGLAGALLHTLKVGSVLTPNVIIDAATANEYRCDTGGGVLVTAGEIAGTRSKRELVEKFHALAVDMEAAAVADVARDEKMGFRCVKAISDEADFVMPPLSQFVDQEGNFQTRRFAAWTAIRPQYWSRTLVLARNSKRASKALCDWLRKNVGDGQSDAVVRIERAQMSRTNS